MTPELKLILGLLIAFQVKHFLGDYLLQSRWMVIGKAEKTMQAIKPLLAHAAVHGGMTLLILLVVAPGLWLLAFVDLAVHALIDLLKSSQNFLGRYNDPSRKSYWMPFGLDQMAHHLTHYAIIFVVVTSGV